MKKPGSSCADTISRFTRNLQLQCAGPDGAYDEEAMAQEVLEPLVRMYYSVTEYDRRAAVRVLALLKRLPVVADLFSRNGIDV